MIDEELEYSTAAAPARSPDTTEYKSIFPFKDPAPWKPEFEHSPAAYKPGIDVAPSSSVAIPPRIRFNAGATGIESIDKNKKAIESVIKSADISSSSIELIDKSILIFAINEMFYGTLDKPIIIDESIRLAKKFSSPDSYKLLNATLDKILKKGV